MELRSALQRHKLSIRVLNDRERSTMDQPNKHEKFLSEKYRNLMWCTHIVSATKCKNLPNRIIVRYANVICVECADKLEKLNWLLPATEKRNFITVQTLMLEKLVDLYCTVNINTQPTVKKFGNETYL